MKKIEFVFVLIIFNFFVVQSKILYLFCGLLFTPYATERLDELRQLIYIFYLNKIRNAKLRKIIYKLNLFDDQRQGAKKISFIENEESESDIVGITDSSVQLSYDDPQPFLPISQHIPYRGATVDLPQGAEQFYKLMNDRRSVRAFSTRPVDYDVVAKCVLAAGTSPSGAHTEPWTFCVIESASMKSAIRGIIEREEYENYTHRMSRQWTADLAPLQTSYDKPYLTDAPYLLLVFKQVYGYRADGSKKQHYYNEISVSIATGILLCALQAAGLSSLVTTPLNCGPALKELLQRPANEKLHVLLPVGYAADDCKVPDLHRKALDKILIKY